MNKPAGLVVHPSAGNWTGTLVNALIAHCGDSLSGIGGGKRAGTAHPLPKNTRAVSCVVPHTTEHIGYCPNNSPTTAERDPYSAGISLLSGAFCATRAAPSTNPSTGIR